MWSLKTSRSLVVTLAVLAGVACFSVNGQAVSGIQVVSIDTNITDHHTTITMANRSSKAVATYALTLLATKADGTSQRGGFQEELVLHQPPAQPVSGLWQPGAVITRQIGIVFGSISVMVFPEAVIYQDDTAEGAPARINELFARRRAQATGYLEIVRRISSQIDPHGAEPGDQAFSSGPLIAQLRTSQERVSTGIGPATRGDVAALFKAVEQQLQPADTLSKARAIRETFRQSLALLEQHLNRRM